jgi:hypothetical protein
MNDLALPVAVSDSVSGQDNNLMIAERERMFLNAFVDLLCSQTSHLMLSAASGGFKP